MKSTEFLKDIWRTEECIIPRIPTVKQKMVRKVYSKTLSNYCKLYLTEKFFIIQSLDIAQSLHTYVYIYMLVEHCLVYWY